MARSGIDRGGTVSPASARCGLGVRGSCGWKSETRFEKGGVTMKKALLCVAMGVVVMSLVIGLAGVATAAPVGDLVFTDDFNGSDDQLLTDYDSNYNITSGGTATIQNGRLRVTATSANTESGVTSYTGLGNLLGGGSHGAGSFVAYTVKGSDAGQPNDFRADFCGGRLGGNVYSMTRWGGDGKGHSSGFYDSADGWKVGGSNQVVRGVDHDFVLVYVGGQTVHIFINGLYNTSFKDAVGVNDVGPSGSDTLRLGVYPGSVVTGTDEWAEFDSLAVGRNAFNEVGGGTAIKANRTLLYGDDFNRAESDTIGSVWSETQSSNDTTFDLGIVDNKVQAKLTANNNDWGDVRAILDLTDPSVLGRGLNVGEYVEFDLQRTGSGYGRIGINLPGSGQTYFDGNAGSNMLQNYANTFGTDQGAIEWDITPDMYNTTDGLKFGYFLGYAGSDFTIVHFYVNDDYAGSALYKSTTFNNVTFRAQIYHDYNAVNDTFTFDNLAIYGQSQGSAPISEPATLGLLGLALLGLRKRRS
jgi:hypothetical protein